MLVNGSRPCCILTRPLDTICCWRSCRPKDYCTRNSVHTIMACWFYFCWNRRSCSFPVLLILLWGQHPHCWPVLLSSHSRRGRCWALIISSSSCCSFGGWCWTMLMVLYLLISIRFCSITSVVLILKVAIVAFSSAVKTQQPVDSNWIWCWRKPLMKWLNCPYVVKFRSLSAVVDHIIR